MRGRIPTTSKITLGEGFDDDPPDGHNVAAGRHNVLDEVRGPGLDLARVQLADEFGEFLVALGIIAHNLFPVLNLEVDFLGIHDATEKGRGDTNCRPTIRTNHFSSPFLIIISISNP